MPEHQDAEIPPESEAARRAAVVARARAESRELLEKASREHSDHNVKGCWTDALNGRAIAVRREVLDDGTTEIRLYEYPHFDEADEPIDEEPWPCVGSIGFDVSDVVTVLQTITDEAQRADPHLAELLARVRTEIEAVF